MDPNLYPKLEYLSSFYQWQITTLEISQTQNVMEVLYPLYIPSNLAANQLFVKKQQYMYAIFNKTLLTDHGKKFVREHQE